MYNKKRGQSEIITTVLIILLVLAAIVIVWQVVRSTVTSGTNQIATQADCMGINLVVVKANQTAVSIRRDPGADKQATIEAILFVNGINRGTVATGLKELDSQVNSSISGGTINTGSDVQLAGKLTSGTLCSLGPATKSIDGAIA